MPAFPFSEYLKRKASEPSGKGKAMPMEGGKDMEMCMKKHSHRDCVKMMKEMKEKHGDKM